MCAKKIIDSEVTNDQIDQTKPWSNEMKRSDIWTTTSQNRLALQLNVEAQKGKNIRKVQEGDTLAAIAKSLGGKIDWSQSVDYRSQKLNRNKKPNILSAANLIYPDQYVWIENGVIIVADECPSPKKAKKPPLVRPQAKPKPAKVPPIPVPPIQQPVKPKPVVVPPAPKPQKPVPPTKPVVAPPIQQPGQPKPPEVIPKTSWRPILSNPRNKSFRDFPAEEKDILSKNLGPAPRDRFKIEDFEPSNLPAPVTAIMDEIKGVIAVPSSVPIYSSLSKDLGSQGKAYGGSLGVRRSFNPATRKITASNYQKNKKIIALNFAANAPRKIRTKNSDIFKMTLLNEFSHFITDSLVDRYARLKVDREVGTPIDQAFVAADLKKELLSGFSHPDVPMGNYSFHEFNELQSDAASFSAYPNFVQHRYLVYGSNPINPSGYSLNRDFTAFHLSKFLKEKGYGNYSKDQVNQAFRDYVNARQVSGSSPSPSDIADEFHFNDPEFVTYIQPKYEAVGKAFYAHLAKKITDLESTPTS